MPKASAVASRPSPAPAGSADPSRATHLAVTAKLGAAVHTRSPAGSQNRVGGVGVPAENTHELPVGQGRQGRRGDSSQQEWTGVEGRVDHQTHLGATVRWPLGCLGWPVPSLALAGACWVPGHPTLGHHNPCSMQVCSVSQMERLRACHRVLCQGHRRASLTLSSVVPPSTASLAAFICSLPQSFSHSTNTLEGRL